VGSVEAAEQLQQGGFAAAAGAADGDVFARVDGEIDAAQGLDAAFVVALARGRGLRVADCGTGGLRRQLVMAQGLHRREMGAAPGGICSGDSPESTAMPSASTNAADGKRRGDDAGGLRQGGEHAQRAPAEGDAEDAADKAEHGSLSLDEQQTRHAFQPMARRMPISRVRSKTDMAMVLAMPRMPISSAMPDVPQATA
jgi:pyruvate/2-oxoglutarate dehydrogenase complex dihydrolipoamide acyltransferase (E2) component